MSNAQAEFKQGQQVLQTVLARSATDQEYRAFLLENPHQALRQSGIDLPDNFKVTFIENHADATVVLPDPVNSETELSEAELEAVAGGSTAMCVFTSIMGTIAIARGIKTIGDDNAWLS